MERLQASRQERGERTGLIQIVLIAAALAAALYGGLRLLGDTHVKFNQRQQEKAAHALAVRKAAATTTSERDKAVLLELARQRAIRRAATEEEYRLGNLRCIGGQLFRRIPNGWENVPGENCAR